MKRIYKSKLSRKTTKCFLFLCGCLIMSVSADLANASPVEDFRQALKKCSLKLDDVCKEMIWSVVDISGDLRISKAEISRLLWLASTLKDDTEVEEQSTMVGLFLFGPIGAQSALDNFDYDGDGFLTRVELEDGRFGAWANKILQRRNQQANIKPVALPSEADSSRNQLDALIENNKDTDSPILTFNPSQLEREKKFTLKSIAALLDKAKKEDQSMIGSSTNERQDFGQPLTLSEVDAVKAKIETCWSMPGGAEGAENFVVRIRFALNPDGSFRGAPKIIDQGSRAGNDAYYRTASAAALRAVQKCEPYDMLPRAKYRRWQDMEMTFDPKEMMGG